MVSGRALSKAIFLDRDGIINIRRTRYVKTVDEFELIPDISYWLKILSKNSFKLIVITNQSMISRKISTKENLTKIHNKMKNEFSKKGFNIDGIYYCPHTQQENCNCRKPKTGLFEKAIRDFSINIKHSWLIGDEETDIIAGKKIGCNTIKIRTNQSIKNAVRKILNDSAVLYNDKP